MARGLPEEAPDSIRFMGIDGLTLAADAWGGADNPAVLFLHGGGQTRHAWAGAAKVMAQHGWYSVAMDLRGHGDSAWFANGDYSGERMCRELISVFAELRERVGGRPVVAVGASMGGLLSLSCSYMQPDCLDALVLVDIAPKTEPAGVKRVLDFMTAHPDGFDSLDQAAEHIASYLPHRQRPDNMEGLKKNLRQRDNGRWYWHWDPALMSGTSDKPISGAEAGYFDRAAAALKLPAMLIRGRMSDVVSAEGAAHFRELVPHAKYVDLKDAAHMVAGDANDAFTDEVLSFLCEHF